MAVPLELSAGVVVFRGSGAGLRFLLLLSAKGHWDFPKGHVEPGETALAATARELREETGISRYAPVPGFEKRLRYGWTEQRRRHRKEVRYRLARVGAVRVRLSAEHRRFRWARPPEALALIRFANARGLLQVAIRYLERRGPAGAGPRRAARR